MKITIMVSFPLLAVSVLILLCAAKPHPGIPYSSNYTSVSPTGSSSQELAGLAQSILLGDIVPGNGSPEGAVDAVAGKGVTDAVFGPFLGKDSPILKNDTVPGNGSPADAVKAILRNPTMPFGS